MPRITWFCYFYPRPPRGGRPWLNAKRHPPPRFLSTPSARRATIFGIKAELAVVISIHALREEGDISAPQLCRNSYTISIHALREEGDFDAMLPQPGRQISIHALREEGDLLALLDPVLEHPISIHALREEGDTTASNMR